jgi:hypothetical protein
MDRKDVVAMTFDLEWAKDPASGGITGSYEADQLWVVPGGGVVCGATTHREGPGYHHVNNSCWWWLIETMQATGMVSDSTGLGIPLRKISDNSGERVLPAEITEALEAYRTSDWHIATAFEDQDDPAWHRRRWSEWTAWLESSVDHGGFRVN